MGQKQFIKSTKVYLENEFKPAILEIEDQIITDILAYETAVQAVDYHDDYIIPGLIDIHTHGYAGWSFTGVTDRQALTELTLKMASFGITSMLTSASYGGYNEIANFIESKQPYTRILGIHAEGPFLNSKQFGAARPGTIFPAPNIEQAKDIYNTCRNHLRYTTIAPENENACEVIEFFREKGVVVAYGHSEATAEEMKEYLPYCDSFTHLGNAMKGIHHRDVGTLGAGMLSDKYCEIISDGTHLCKDMLDIILRIKDWDKLVVISDSIGLSGLKPGEYNLPDHTINVREKDGAIINEFGRIGGSGNCVKDNLVCLHRLLQIPFEKVLPMATINAATLIKEPNIGLIKKGYHADITVLNSDYQTIATYVNGNKVYDQNTTLDYQNPRLDSLLHNPEFINYYK